jgi:hypothetical protein
MPEPIISALVQAPFVLAMAYLVQRFLTHLKERDQEWHEFVERTHQNVGQRLEDLTEAVEQLTLLIVAHDAAMRGQSPPSIEKADDLMCLFREKP